MDRLSVSLRLRSELSEAEAARMYALYSHYYDAVSPDGFHEDLAGKRWIIQLSEDSQLRGFSTVAIDELVALGVRRRAIFSGDTIIDHRYWGKQALADTFCQLAGALKALEPATPLYWFLITKGYRTFRYLNLFARRYFPHPEEPTPPDMAACIHAMALRRFGSAWNQERGLVCFEKSHGHLKPEWAGVRGGLRRRKEVEFFLRRNPGYVHGDELACITELTNTNLRSRAARAFERGLREAPSILSIDR